MRQLECFKALDKKKYIIWSDVGPHFRSGEFLHYLFRELALCQIEVSFNLFCEKHGKNSRDQHFSVVSNFINQESMVSQLTSSEDICNAIEKRQHLANINNERLNSLQKQKTGKKYKYIHTKAFIVPTYTFSEIESFKLVVPGMRKYYNFFTDKTFILKTHFMSDKLDFEVVESKEIIKKIPIDINPKPDKILPIKVNHKYLRSKMNNWKIMQRVQTCYINESQIVSDQNLGFNNSIYEFCDHKKCTQCKENCKYRLSELHDSNTILTQTQINNELKIHGHPKSRVGRNRKNRTLIQAKSELRNHFIKFHSL